MNTSGKTIVITGGNSGIGYELVKQLHTNNKLIIISRSQKNWVELNTLDNNIHRIQCDLSKMHDVITLADSLITKNDPIDIVVHCAAIQLTPKLTEKNFSFSGIETEINTNFTSVIWLTHRLLPKLLKRPKASIVNITSGLAIYPKTESAVYSATKAALHSFSQSLRYQLENTPITVTEVLLPLVDTPMTRGRGKRKMPPDIAAMKIIAAIQSEKSEVYVGKARCLPLLSRIWPKLIKNILKRY